jgi:hypothetical protein
MRIGYAKLGRSMPLTLAACGTLGGDIEMTAALVALAKSRPDDEFVLIGRNSNDDPNAAGLPPNVINPWVQWAPRLREYVGGMKRRLGIAGGLNVEGQREVVDFMHDLTRDTFLSLDNMVMWIGQHGTTNSPIPKIEDRSILTKPYDWSIFYASFLLNGINAWRDVDPWQREEICLNADPRNHHKMRDLKWPLRHPILTQYNFTNNIKHERYGDYDDRQFRLGARLAEPDVWESTVQNVYSRLELNALVPGTPSGDLVTYNEDWHSRDPFGIVINEARAIGIRPEMSRLTAMREYVAQLAPAWVYGTWSAASMTKLASYGFKTPINPLPWRDYIPTIQTVRSTFTTPSSGSHWATTKPWEAFGAGVVCFFHPEYDKQGHILADAPDWLRTWLCVENPDQLRERVAHLSTAAGRLDWLTIVRAQRAHFDAAMQELRYLKMINDRLDGKANA